MAGERWIFTKPQLLETPSRKCGVDIDKELSYRQQAANLIQEMGQRLQTNQLCINTAIVYMHRFYMFHSFTKFNRNVMSPACLFLAAKVEEQPRKLEHVIKTAHSCLREGSLDTKSETYLEYAQELIINENILLQTLGFEVRVDHPHTTVVTTCQLVRETMEALAISNILQDVMKYNCDIMKYASKDLAQTSYFLATNSLHLTTMCLQQKPNVVACVCIHLACKWSGYEIPSSHEGKLWFNYVDKNISLDLLEELTQDFLNILDKCPSRLKKKIMTWRSGKNGDEGKGDAGQSTSKGGSDSSKSKTESSHSRNIFEDSSAIINEVKGNSERSQHSTSTASSSGTSRSTDSKSHSGHPPLNIKDYKQHKEYKERKEKERMAGFSSHTSVKPHGNGDVKRSHHQGQGRVDPERKATQHAFDSLHHMSREDAKRHETKREHDSPLKMTIKPDKSRSHEMSSKAVKRSHQSDNETSDGSERHSKHRRSETHPLSNDNFPAGTINHSDLFSGQNYPPSSNKLDSGNGNSGSERHSKNRTAYSEGGSNSDRAMWNSGKSSTKSPGSSSAKSSNSSRKDRSIFSPPQHLSHHPPPPPHMIQNKLGLNPGGPPPPPPHVLTKGNMNASFDQSYQRSHPPNYGHAQYPNPNMMGNTYQDSQHSAVQGMNSNGGPMPGSNQQEVIGDLQSQLQNLINHQKYQIAQQQAQSQPSIFDIDLLDSDLGMPPLPPPLPQNNAPQPPPPPY